MFLIVGLGNPGRQYAETRHNVGFRAVEMLASRLGCSLSRQRFHAVMGEARYADEKVVLLEPQTYMNLSGQAVVAASGFYQIANEQLIVLHDDLDLELGRMKLQWGGGHAGHKGVRSITELMGTSLFVRLRIGIGRPSGPMAVPDYVLTPFDALEMAGLDAVLTRGCEAVESVLTVGLVEAMNRFNQKKRPDRQSGEESR